VNERWKPRYYILNALGEPEPCADVLSWAQWFEANNERRVIARDTHGDVRVSTVFLGLDHSFLDGPPVLWESMVFGGPLDGEQYRYHRRHEALAGHEELLQRVQAAARGEPEP
jgi:hypothetical protein